jgi:hypothetical protein
MRDSFPSPPFLKQLEVVLQEEWYKIQPETIRNLYKFILRRTATVLEAKVGPISYERRNV